MTPLLAMAIIGIVLFLVVLMIALYVEGRTPVAAKYRHHISHETFTYSEVLDILRSIQDADGVVRGFVFEYVKVTDIPKEVSVFVKNGKTVGPNGKADESKDAPILQVRRDLSRVWG